MGVLIVVLSIAAILGVLQIILSKRQNKYLGLIIPFINLLVSVFMSVLFSDMFAAFFIFFISLLPLILWLCIYQNYRRKTDELKQSEINRMRINDL